MYIPRDSFTLNSKFVSEYEGKQPQWGPLGYLVYKRTYANELPDGGTEEFWQTCKRVIEGMYQIQKGHCKRLGLPWNDRKAQKSAQEAYLRMFEFKWLPPGRGLSKMGTEHMFKIGGACLNNCGFFTTANIGNKDIDYHFAEPFAWLMDMSMLGVGVGLDTRGNGKVTIIKPTPLTTTYIVGDSREGWVAYIKELLQSYVDPKIKCPIDVDYSQVRPKGSKIHGFGGTASGPESLQLLTTRVTKRLDEYIGKVVDSKVIVDIANSIGECVVAGGVRRTAEIVFAEADDEQFLTLKDYNVPETKDWPRWASNNSVFADANTNFHRTAALTATNGEPGYYFLKNAQNYSRMADPPDYKDYRVSGGNPCLEQSLESEEICCLVETFPHNCVDYADYQRTLKFAYLYAKTVTLVPTHYEGTNAVMFRNRRIGCSQSGIQDNIIKRGLRQHFVWCDDGYNYLRKLDEVYSDWLCIPRSIKRCSVKPSGTTSKLVGCREGIHHEKAEYIFQTIRINDDSPLIKPLQDAGYRIETAVNERNTVVVYFPVHTLGQRPSETISMWEQLEIAALMQHYWADNQVSVTIDFDKEKEGPYIQQALEMYAHRLKGVSFLPRNDHGYVQAPKQVTTKEIYDAYVANLKPYTLEDIQTRDSEEKFCDGGVCSILPVAAE